MWEFTSGIPPFNDKAHDFQLALSICRGERPEIIENTPQCYIDLMKKCWDKDPLKRPNASEVCRIIGGWLNFIIDCGKINDIAMEFWKSEEKQTDMLKGSLEEFWKSEEKQTDMLKNINDKIVIKSCISHKSFT